MAFPLFRPDWQLPKKKATSETVFFNRRRFMRQSVKWAAGASLGSIGAIALNSCRPPLSDSDRRAFESTLGRPLQNVTPNPNFRSLEASVTQQQYASRFNNYYEFGGTKNIWQQAQSLPSERWQLSVTGLVNNPKTYDAAESIDALF